jgi:hypothetical protein
MRDNPVFCERDKSTLTDLEVNAVYMPGPVFGQFVQATQLFMKKNVNP